MAVTESTIAHFAKRFEEATGKAPNRFVCPITLLDDPNAELCDGHILCDKLKSASKLTVVQRKDVDNRFGSYIESDFVKFANFRDAAQEDILRAGHNLTITSSTGERMPAFFARDEAKVRFQQLEMYDENGKTVATPYLKSHTLEAGQYKQLQVEWMLYIHKHCFTAAMLKSAYLNMFRVFGYAWALDASGEKVRRTLATGFIASDRNAALNQFSEFHGCCWIAGQMSGDSTLDSLTDNRLLFHFAEGDAQGGLLFGITSLFCINSVLTAVTVPASNRLGHYFVSWDYYQQFIREHQLCHNIHFVRVDDAVRIDPKPMSLEVVDRIPPDNTTSRTLSPCQTSDLTNTDLTGFL
jgi:hypothetical protein